MRCAAVVVVACALLLSLNAEASAQSPWGEFSLFKKVEADPNNEYPLTPEHGPWMIMAATFSGQSAPRHATPQQVAAARESQAAAEQQARDLVLELRRDYKIEAYLHRVQFDHTRGAVYGQGVDSRGRSPKMRYLRARNERNQEIAVLVGNYSSVTDRQAQADLKKVKDVEPDVLSVNKLAEAGKKTYQQLAGLRLAQKTLSSQAIMRSLPSHLRRPGVQIKNETRKYGPMGSAILTRNPLRENEPAEGGAIDKFVWEMNMDVPNSLLKSRGGYTVKVATFTGSVIVDQRKIRAIEEGEKKLQSRLTRAAEDAHRLAEALQVLGYEAYEFHDRFASIVTVGSFDSAGSKRPDGKIEINPKAHQVIKTFGADPVTGKPKQIVGIPLDVQPVMVIVPKRSFAADYARGDR